MNPTEYKIYHESFIQNNQGSTAIHTFLCIFFTVQCSLLSAIEQPKNGFIQYFQEYIWIVLPLIVAHTILSNFIHVLNIVMFSFILYKFISIYRKLEIIKTFKSLNNYDTNHIRSISILRGLTYLITVYCILAVDFQSFPRHLAKTERYGYSLMDTGVGLFVIMSGLVHRDIRKYKLSSIIKSNVKFISVLVLLGVARFISVKQLDYHEHVTEYGVHWNFFFTLAICKLLSTLFLYITNLSFFLSIVTIFAHELMLDYGVQDWVFSDTPRTNFLTANREGISSSLGYVSMYLYAVHVKNILNNRFRRRYSVVLRLFIESVCLWILLYYLNTIQQTSRTLANAGYCVYLAATLTTVLFVMYPFEVLLQDKNKTLFFYVPLTLSAINENGLLYFLIANLLTGAVNLSIRTLLVSSTVTFIILNAYMIVTILIAVYLRKKGVKV